MGGERGDEHGDRSLDELGDDELLDLISELPDDDGLASPPPGPPHHPPPSRTRVRTSG